MITVLPPGPVDLALHYDLHAWHRRAKAMTLDSQLTFNDNASMHLIARGGRRKRWIPAFAYNDTQLRDVLAQTVWQRAHGAFKTCGGPLTLQQLKRVADSPMPRGKEHIVRN